MVEPVAGAPYQLGERVRVTRAVDRDVDDLSPYVGQSGRVAYLDYDCGCGQSYPGDPMVGVELDSGLTVDFWREELAAA